MKKTILSLMLLTGTFMAKAQSGDFPQNEIKFNILNVIALGSVEIGYEYYLDEHQSVGLDVLINDTYNMSIGRQVEDFNTNSFQLSYNYNISRRGDGSGFIISPLLKFRVGDYQKTDLTPKIDMNSFIIGIGAGYKWSFNNRFVMGPYANIGRNFSEEVTEEFTKIEFSAGFNLGFKF
ncbi:MAG: DUF3575 domain-containing protein [Flavobacterium sp.]|nr:MAG: DUF3575 domain-containing protein [Flavobacterium sp.]